MLRFEHSSGRRSIQPFSDVGRRDRPSRDPRVRDGAWRAGTGRRVVDHRLLNPPHKLEHADARVLSPRHAGRCAHLVRLGARSPAKSSPRDSSRRSRATATRTRRRRTPQEHAGRAARSPPAAQPLTCIVRKLALHQRDERVDHRRQDRHADRPGGGTAATTAWHLRNA